MDPRKQEELNAELHEAVQAHETHEVARLLDRGAQVDAQDPANGYTPLHKSCKSGDFAVVKLLVDRGAQIDRRDNLAYLSPLSAAVRCRSREIVELLLARGADPAERVHSTTSSLSELAKALGDEDLARVLRRRPG